MWRGCKEGNKVGLQGIKRNRNSVWGVDVEFHTIFTSVLDGSERSDSCPCHFTPYEGVLVSNEEEILWAAGPSCMFWKRPNSLASDGNSQSSTS
jgi:hypothetical protein